MTNNPEDDTIKIVGWPRARRSRNMTNWQWAREKDSILNDVTWLRPNDLEGTSFPRPVVLVTGAFDLMHSPHMRLLFTAREKAGARGTVIVAMNSDEHIKARKGPGRPIMTFPERAAALAYMPIDVLVEFESEAELKTVALLSGAEFQVAGAEYYGKPTTCGLPLVCVREGGPHTSQLIERINKEKKS